MLTRTLWPLFVGCLALVVGCVPPAQLPPTASDASANGAEPTPPSDVSPRAQQFFDQGLRLAWGFYFPEAIASHQEAARFAPDHPMPYWGMAHAMGPNPNSRYGRMPLT